MKCPRCAGLMTRDDCHDLDDRGGEGRFVAWHCLICGEILDPLILQHRRSPPERQVDRARLPLKVRHLLKVR